MEIPVLIIHQSLKLQSWAEKSRSEPWALPKSNCLGWAITSSQVQSLLWWVFSTNSSTCTWMETLLWASSHILFRNWPASVSTADFLFFVSLAESLKSKPDLLSFLLRLSGSLNLEENDLSGTLPPKLGELTELEFFSIQKNSFVGQIPELGSLTALSKCPWWPAPSNAPWVFLTHSDCSPLFR